MSEFAVIFDTNSYRKLVSGKTRENAILAVNELVELEEINNIISYGSVIVGMEMLANLVEGKDGINYNDCLNGVVVMAKHCNDSTGDAPRVIPHAALLIEHSLFGEIISQEMLKNTQNLGGTIRDFRDSVDEAIEHHKKVNSFEDIKQYIEMREEEFSNQIEELVKGAKLEVKRKHPSIDAKGLRSKVLGLINSEAFLKMFSEAIVEAIHINTGEFLSEQERSKKATFLRDFFPVSAGFFQWVCYEVVDKNIDLQSKSSKSKRWNWLWDYHVSYAVSNAGIKGRKVLLITSDEGIHQALKKFGFSDRVMTLEQYFEYLRLEN